jgi:penicillin amidase
MNNSHWIIATGASGHPASPHYRDQIDKWRRAEYDPMLWEPERIKTAAVSKLILQPK